MLAASIKEYLDSHQARYITIPHPPAFTAQEIAASTHIPGRELAKTVMVKLDGEMAMVALPADRKLDLGRLRNTTRAQLVRLATEEEFRESFPGCELGAMPPFGEPWGLDVYAATELTEDAEIAFNGGTHTDLVRLPYAEFARLARPRVVDVCARC